MKTIRPCALAAGFFLVGGFSVGRAQTLISQLEAANYNSGTGLWIATVGPNAHAVSGDLNALQTGVTPNGASAVSFGANQHFTYASTLTARTASYTILAFAQPATASGSLTIVGGQGGSDQNPQYRIYNGHQDALQQNQTNLGSGNATLAVNPIATQNSPQFSSISTTLSSSGGTFRINGAADGSNAAATFLAGITTVGAQGSPANGENFSGDIAEIQVYDGVLTDAQRAAVEQQFIKKYVWPEGSNSLDRVDFGNLSSETAHNFDAGFSAVPLAGVGAFGQTYRAPLTSGTTSTNGELSVTMKVSPTLQNYVTVRLWGSDNYGVTVDFTAFANGNLDAGCSPPPFPNRFYYSTLPIPLAVTSGHTSITLVFYENNVTGASYSTAGRPIYSAYTHTDPHFIPAGADPTGSQPALNGQLPTSSALTLGQVCSLLEENRKTIYQNTGTTTNPSDYYDQLLARQIPVGQAGAPPEVIGLDLHANVASWVAANPNATPDQWRDQCGGGQYGPGYASIPDEMLSVLTSTYFLAPFTDQNGGVVSGLDHYHDATIIPRIVNCLDGCTYLQASDGHLSSEPDGVWSGLTSTPRAAGHTYAGSTSRGPFWSIGYLEGADTETLGRIIVHLLSDPTAAPLFEGYLTQTGNYDLTGTPMPRYQAYERMLNNEAGYLYSIYWTGTVSQGLMDINGMYACEVALTKLQALYPYPGGASSTFPNDSYSYPISYPAVTSAAAISYVQQITGAVAASNLPGLYVSGYTNYGISMDGFGEAHGSLSGGYDGRYGTIEPWEIENLVRMASWDPAVSSSVLSGLQAQARKAVDGFLHFISPEEDFDGFDEFTLSQEDFITYRDPYQINADCRSFTVGCGYLAADPSLGIQSVLERRGAYLECLYNVLPLSEGNKGGFDSLEYLDAMGSYETVMRGLVNVNPSTITPLPGEAGQPNSALVDPMTGATAIYFNGERLYMNNNVDDFEYANNSYGKASELARVHDTTSTVDQDGMLSLPFNAATQQSDGNTSGNPGQTWVMRYGNWLIAGNPSGAASTLALPPGVGTVIDVVSGHKYGMGSSLSLPAGGSVALNMPVATTSQLLANGTYVMTNFGSQLALNCPNGATTNNLQMVQAASPPGTASQWVVTYAGSGYYTLQNAASGLYLTSPTSSNSLIPLVQQPSNGQANQLWQLIQSGGCYYVVNKSSGLAVNDPGSSKSAGTGMIVYPQDAGVNSAWAFQNTAVTTVIPNGTYTLASLYAGTLMDDPSSSTTAGQAMAGQTADGGNDQKWVFTSNGNGYYTIQNLASGLYLTPAGKVASWYWPNLVQEPASGSDLQLWSILPAGRGYSISNKSTTDMINLGNTNPGATITMDYYQPGDRYQWTIK